VTSRECQGGRNLVPLVVKWDVPHCAIVSSTFISCGNKTIDRMKSLVSVFAFYTFQKRIQCSVELVHSPEVQLSLV
jgi:hypothetical protein